MPHRRQPNLFVSHGAPTLAIDPIAGADFVRLGQDLPRPRAVLVVSAHWQRTPPTIGTRTRRPLLHDYAGFPAALGRVTWPGPAAATLADEVAALIPGLAHDDERPWDHGVWTPLVHLFPDADVPVLQLSLPSDWPTTRIHALGRSLRPLRDAGVLLLASGGAVHNLYELRQSGPPPTWAVDFETWLRERLTAGDDDAIVDFQRRAPAPQRAHPTDEHFLPLLVALGARDGDAPVFPIEGWEYGSLSRLAVRFG
jgi:4,5-DOPA dioxygenase extradiol